MKYFTKELWAGLNESLISDKLRYRKLSKQWDRNLDAYLKQLELIKPRLSKNSKRFFTEVSLHDGRLLSFVVGDNIKHNIYSYEQFDRNRGKIAVIMQVVNYEQDAFYTLRYTAVRRVLFDFPTDDPLSSEEENQIGDWGYDELTFAKDNYLRHEVLFASGATILIEFKHFSFKRMRAKNRKDYNAPRN